MLTAVVRNTRPIRDVLRTAGVPRLLAADLIGRLPTGMAALALVLLARYRGADYTLAGLLAGGFAVGQAIGGPVLARLVDRTRQPPVLVGAAFVAAIAFGALAFIDLAGQPIVAIALVVLAGAATPPLEPCLRALWSLLLPDQRAVHAAYSLDAAAQELLFVGGPLVVVASVSVFGGTAGILVAAAVGLVGAAWFATAGPARRWRGAPGERHWAGALRSGRLARLLVMLVFAGGAVGTFTVAVTAFAEQAGVRPAAGWLVTANGLGALIGGLVYTAVPAGRDPSARLRLLAGCLALGFLPLALTPNVWIGLPLAVLSGLFLPPVLACAFILVDQLAPPGTVTEAFAWVVTAFSVGYATGSAVAGYLADHVGAAAGLWAAVAGGVLATLVSVPRFAPAMSQEG
ncbi:MFS transporter [Fodinicola feengrottensis]|uniref:MFS transporter n=1 Tax=Fodinicola feengrottensis TaxID=435914 RepID=A0ABN2HVL9_9ACTN